MPDVIFSSEFRETVLTVFNGTSGFYTFRTDRCRIAIYTAGNGLSNIGARTLSSCDGLTTGRLWYAPLGTVSITKHPSNDYGSWQMSTGYRSASATGTAAEFLVYSGNSNSPSSTQASMMGGTVSGPGGGGDMIISDTNIISGSSYRILNWISKVLYDFSY